MQKKLGYINVSGMTLAALLFGYALLTSTPGSLRQSTQDMFAAVGVTLAVAPNQYNSQAQQLAAKETLLNKREADLATKERTATQVVAAIDNNLGLYSLLASLVLCILIACNFYFDMRRSQRATFGQKFSVDLR